MNDQVPHSSSRLRQMASDLERAVSEAHAEHIAARALARATAHPPHRRRAAVLVTALSMSLLVGLGVSSANTLPGDSLYGVSRAYEEVGARVGVVNPVERRLNEVIALADRGDTELAARAAEEALAALGYAPDLSVALPPVTTTTESPGSGDEGNNGRTPATDPADTTTVEVSDEELAETKVRSLRLAAEMVLSNMQDNGENLEAAAAELARAVSGVATVEKPPVVAEPTTTTSTTVVETTSTTTTDSTTTSTTVPDSTTTTVVDEEAGEDDGPGPIFLPPSP